MTDYTANVNGSGMSGFLRVTQTPNESSNTSTVTGIFYVIKTSGTGTYGTLDSGVITLNGSPGGNTGGSVSITTADGYVNVASHSITVAHDASGYLGSIVVSANVYIGPPASWTTGATGNQTFTGFSNFVRPPLAPAVFTSAGPPVVYTPTAPTLSRTGTGGTIAVTSIAPQPRTPVTTTTSGYNFQHSTTSTTGPWTGPVSMTNSTSTATDFTGTTATSVYWIQTQAVNSEGVGAWSPSAVAYAAPSISSATSVGTTATVVLAAPASNGGSTINATTGYSIDYSTDSAFATFSTKSSVGVGSVNITGLLPGNTYYFRAKYVNSASVTSPYSASASTFIAAYGRRYAVSGSITNVTTTSFARTVTYYSSDTSGGSFGTPYYTYFVLSSTSGLSVGDSVVVTGIAAPNGSLNQTYTIVGFGGPGSFYANVNNGVKDSVSFGTYGTATRLGDVTYTAANSFSANDTVTITGVTPSAYNLTDAAIKSATSNAFVITSTALGTYSSSTGTASSWARMLTGKRYAADAGSGSPGWVQITVAQKYSGAWSSFNN